MRYALLIRIGIPVNRKAHPRGMAEDQAAPTGMLTLEPLQQTLCSGHSKQWHAPTRALQTQAASIRFQALLEGDPD